MKIAKLTLNHLCENLGLEERLQCSWAIESERRNTVQAAYRLQCATAGDFSEIALDTGWIPSAQSQNVLPECGALKPLRTYWVRVCVETADGQRSEWSKPTCFVTGRMGMPWRARWITAEVPPCPERSSATCVRGSFFVDGTVAEAWLLTTAHGVYTPWLNGRRVGGDLLAPGWTSYSRHMLYQLNDVASLLVPGENVLGAMLGAGWYMGLMGFLSLRNNYGDRTAFLGELIIRYTDGRETIVTTDENWRGCDAPITFSEIYDGEHYDARLEKKDWNRAGSSDAGWHEVAAVEGRFDVLQAQPGCRVRCERVLPAVSLTVTPKGERVVDFGQNLTGWPEFTLRGRANQTCRLRCFETLDANGNVYTANLRSARQALEYICAEDGEVCYHPSFTFYGFRYLYLEQWPEDVTAEDFRAWVIHSEMEPTGAFECSEPLVNQLHHNILWGLKGNFLDVPTDCPQRNERMGWTGDAQIFCQTAAYLMDVYAFYRKWLCDVRADQTEDGGVPHVVPDIITGRAQAQNDWLLGQGTHSAAGWADAIVICPWVLYLNYGDPKILEENYEAMRAWIEFMHTHAVDGIWNYKLQFGDWVALDAAEGSYFGATPNDLTCTAYYAHSTQLFARIAKILGRTDDAARYSRLHAQIVDKFRAIFFTAEGDMTVQTQTAHILALHFDLVPPQWRARTAAALVRLLEKEGGHLVTGFMGTTFFTHALAENGYVDEAYDLLLKEDFPSWLYQVRMGATTVWEHWDGMRPDGSMWSPDMNSFNHYAYGSIGEWLYQGVLGIRADADAPGYHHILLQPRISGKMRYARGSLETGYGTVCMDWRWEGERLRIRTTIPANTTATLKLNCQQVLEADGAFFTKEGEALCAALPSGEYEFLCC